jgi:tetratricopeptide (TPR) repeat protein
MNSRLSRVLLVLVFLLLPAQIHAQDADLERAKDWFKAGATAYAAGDYLAAIQAFDAAYELTPLPAIAFSLAQAERRQYFADHDRAHLDRAIKLFSRYNAQVQSGGRRADALDALSQLEPLAATLERPNAPRTPLQTAAPRQTRLMITSDAPRARLSLDGGPASASPLIREVEPGQHRVEVSAAGFFPSQRDLVAVAGELIPVDVPLREQPSKVELESPEGAEVYLDGAFVSEGGAHVSLQLPSGPHRLAVAQKGRRLWAQTIALERGEVRSIRVTLEPTRQRAVALTLFIGSAAALGTGVVLSALAVRAEGRAEGFLGKKSQVNVTSAELSRYKGAIADRNRYRTATAVTLASSLGLFITGLCLHELDRPNPQELYRSPPPERPGPTPAPEQLRLSLLPLLAPDGFGAAIHAAF